MTVICLFMNFRPVDELTRYPDMKQTRKALSYTAKQLIANEVQLEKQRLLDRKSRYDKKTTQNWRSILTDMSIRLTQLLWALFKYVLSTADRQ